MVFKLVKPLMIALLISACSPEMVALNVAPTVISAGIDVVQKISSSNSTSSTQSTSEVISSLSEADLCRSATVNGNWETRSPYLNHVKEAKRRGLSCGVARELSASALCSKATVSSNYTQSWAGSSAVSTYVAEAKSRGLNCGVDDALNFQTASTLVSNQTSATTLLDFRWINIQTCA